MASLKEFFDEAGESLTYDELTSAIKANGSKFVDLTEGNYVAKNKYENEVQSLTSQIEQLNGTLGTRDTDLADLKTKLEAAGADSSKIASLTSDLAALQSKYDTDTKAFQAKLDGQAYEFAVKEFANKQQFSSNAAKREFIRSMVAEGLKMKDGNIIGADDFLNTYSQDNADSFIEDEEDYFADSYGEEEEEEYEPYEPEYTPQFVAPTPGGEPVHDAAQAFTEAFHFTGVRPMPE